MIIGTGIQFLKPNWAGLIIIIIHVHQDLVIKQANTIEANRFLQTEAMWDYGVFHPAMVHFFSTHRY